MKDQPDGLVSYFIGVTSMLYGFVLSHSNDILTIGGLILLLLRLYVDGSRAFNTFKERRNERRLRSQSDRQDGG